MDISVAYGIDQTSESLTVVKARSAGRDFIFETVYRADGPKGAHKAAAEISALSEEATNARTTVIAAAMPASRAVTRWLGTPFFALGKAMRVLPSMLDLQLPFPLESCFYSFAALGKKPGKGYRALAIASRRDDVYSRLKQLKDCGVDPLVLDHEALALWHRATQEKAPTPNVFRVVLHTGPSAWTLVVGQGSGFLSSHAFRIADENVEASSMVPRIQRILRSQCNAPDRTVEWIWTGTGMGGDRDREGIESRLQEDRRIEFQLVKDPATFLARSLAAHALSPDMTQWNLRRNEIEHPGWIRARTRSQRKASVACMVVGLLLIATNLAWRSVLDRENRQAQVQVTSLATEITGLSAQAIPRGLELHTVKTHFDKNRPSGDPFARALSPGVSHALYTLTAAAASHGLSITEFRTSDDTSTFEMWGGAKTFNACHEAQADLARGGYKVEVESGDAAAGGPVRYRMSGALQYE